MYHVDNYLKISDHLPFNICYKINEENHIAFIQIFKLKKNGFQLLISPLTGTVI